MIVVTGITTEEHLKNLGAVLEKLVAAGLKLNRNKCVFMAPSVKYLGHCIDKDGLHPTEDKVKCIKEVVTPQNVTELKAFLGLVNYYARFLPHLAAKMAPLYRLLLKQCPWEWAKEQEDAFIHTKSLLQSTALLVRYDTQKPLVLACDASPYRVGAVLSHVMGDGLKGPPGFTAFTAYTVLASPTSPKHSSCMVCNPLALVLLPGCSVCLLFTNDLFLLLQTLAMLPFIPQALQPLFF